MVPAGPHPNPNNKVDHVPSRIPASPTTLSLLTVDRLEDRLRRAPLHRPALRFQMVQTG